MITDYDATRFCMSVTYGQLLVIALICNFIKPPRIICILPMKPLFRSYHLLNGMFFCLSTGINALVKARRTLIQPRYF